MSLKSRLGALCAAMRPSQHKPDHCHWVVGREGETALYVFSYWLDPGQTIMRVSLGEQSWPVHPFTVEYPGRYEIGCDAQMLPVLLREVNR